MKRTFLAVITVLCFFSSLPCRGQEPAQVIYLSPGEAAKAQQSTENYEKALDRNNRAVTAWRNFQQSYQAAHPELPNLRFASDFKIAFARKNMSREYPLNEQAATVELSSEEQRKAQSLYSEMQDAKRARDEAEKTWSDSWHQLVADRIPKGSIVTGYTLSSGQHLEIAQPWASGLIFTSDFRIAVPR